MAALQLRHQKNQKISSPIITAIQSTEQASKSKADERTQALQGLAAVANGYQAYNALSNGGALVKAEVGLGVRTASHSQTVHQSSGQNNTLTGENHWLFQVKNTKYYTIKDLDTGILYFYCINKEQYLQYLENQ